MSQLKNRYIKCFIDIKVLDGGRFSFRVKSHNGAIYPRGSQKIPCKWIDDEAKIRLRKQWSKENTTTIYW